MIKRPIKAIEQPVTKPGPVRPPHSTGGRKVSNWGGQGALVPGYGQGTASNAPTAVPPGVGPSSPAFIGNQYAPRLPILAFGATNNSIVARLRRLFRGR